MSGQCECRGKAGERPGNFCPAAASPEDYPGTEHILASARAAFPATHVTECEVLLCEMCLSTGRKTGVCCGCGKAVHAIPLVIVLLDPYDESMSGRMP